MTSDRSATHRNERSRAVALAGLVVFIVIVALEHAFEPRLDPARHQISEYATAGLLMTVGFAAWAASLLATAVLTRGCRIESAFWFVAAVGMAVTAGFETQTVAGQLPPDVEYNLGGRLHDVGSGATALGLLGSALVFASTHTRWRTIALGVVAAAGILNVALLIVGPEVGGVRQRLLLVLGCGWQFTLVRVSRSASHPGVG